MVCWAVWKGLSNVILLSLLLLKSWTLKPDFTGIRKESAFLFDTNVALNTIKFHLDLLRQKCSPAEERESL